jgi:hypothetical protein
MPWAIALTIVRPHEKVLSVQGDGGVVILPNELETAIPLNSHPVHIIGSMVTTTRAAFMGGSVNCFRRHRGFIVT